ncbi:MAG: mechanosensitive ion channel family protein [Spirochaetaceae bacterium]
MTELLSTEFFGRTVADYAISIGLAFVALFVLGVIGASVRRAQRRHLEGETQVPRSLFLFRLVLRTLLPASRIGALYLAVMLLEPSEQLMVVLRIVVIILITWYVVRLIDSSVDAAFSAYAEKRGETGTKRIRPLMAVINLLVWVVALIFLLDNLDIEISAIVAGLGIGGIAIALAAQALLGDLFSYFVIFFDRPFELGDFLVFDDILGTVEHIGLKTTHIRSLGGELIVVANSILTGSRLRNYKHMSERRVVFSFGVTYNTGAERLREIPGVVRGIVEAEDQARFDRAHFKAYGASSLDFEVVYYVLSPDFNIYMDIQERINLAIYEAFEERGIKFAFPTRTVYLSGNGGGTYAS